jgi:hypothetical protein
MYSSRFYTFRRPSFPQALVAVISRRVAESWFAQIKFEPDVDALSRASGQPVWQCRKWAADFV